MALVLAFSLWRTDPTGVWRCARMRRRGGQGGILMRQLAFGSIILVLVVFGRGAHSVGQEILTPRGELRVVDKHPANWAWVTFNVFEHLIEIDKDGKLIPGLATSWQWLNDHTLEVKLRRGVKFHNEEIFDAEIVKLNWEENTRLRQPHMIGAFLNFKRGSSLEIVDPETVRFLFPEPDGGALAKLTQIHIGNRQFYQEFGWGEESW
jgi:ABC-type transport system substrate-binding protein